MRKVWAFIKIDDPFVAWECSRGVLISAKSETSKQVTPLSLWMTKKLQTMNFLATKNEFRLELIRRQSHPQIVSRLECLYCFESESAAKSTIGVWGSITSHFRQEFLCELELLDGAKVTKVDSNWITDNLNKPSVSNEWMYLYWQGNASNNHRPIWELLVSGRMKVLRDDLRERAAKTLLSRFPESERLLQLSKISADLGSDLGHIFAQGFSQSHNEMVVSYLMNFEDADNRNFIDKLRVHPVYVNTPLIPKEALTTPNFTEKSFKLTVKDPKASLFSDASASIIRSNVTKDELLKFKRRS